MSQNVSSAAVVIVALRVNNIHIKLLESKAICYINSHLSSILLVNFIYILYKGLNKHNFMHKSVNIFLTISLNICFRVLKRNVSLRRFF